MSTSVKTTTSYVKLAIPGNKNGNDSHIELQKGLLYMLVSHWYQEVKCDEEKIKVSNDCEDPFYEITFENIPIPLKSSVILTHLDLFDQTLLCAKPDIPTESIHFGNIWNNEFYDHWNVFFPAEIRKAKYRDITLNSLKTSFDFDKSWPVTITFNVNENFEKFGFVVSKYQLSIEGPSIRQIIVDPFGEDNQERRFQRLYFVLKYPVVIRRSIVHKDAPKGCLRVLQLPSGINTDDKSTERVLTENRVFCLEFNSRKLDSQSMYTIISRLRCRWNIPVELANYTTFRLNGLPICTETPNRSVYFSKNPAYYTEIDFENYLKQIFPWPRYTQEKRVSDRINERKFAYTYLIEALFSRGTIVKDQLLIDQNRWRRFLDIIRRHVNDDINNDVFQRHCLCESALEDLLNHVDNQPRVGDLLDVFERLCEARKKSKQSNQLTDEQWKEGFRKTRKALLTTTRKIYLAPEMIMSNRAVTGVDHDGTRIIRTTIRDDNFQKMRQYQLGDLLSEKVMRRLKKGFVIMGRSFSYLASSNSQMREGGTYHMERFNKKQLDLDYPGIHLRKIPSGYKPKILAYRKKLGKFEKTGSISKAMARLGQCFTQARACIGIEIGNQDYQMVPDAIGGKNANGAPYMYTDGVGMISARLAQKIAKSMKLPNGFVPSAYQIRFRGLKGMLVVDPSLDNKADYFKDIYRRGLMRKETNSEEIDLAPYTFKCLFRESQMKFHSSKGGKDKWPIELVKWSSPTPVTLNRPFINILDQVSALQSLDCHKRICGRIEELLDIEMDSFTDCIINEDKCRSKLEGMPRRVHFPSLWRRNGFSLCTEPFFRALIKAAIDFSMMRLLKKVNIPIPSNVGRSMFGVTDETGLLQYGQVFVQYTENVNNKHPSGVSGKILKGPLMVTKFPSMCEGDVRMYEAVDIPELRHLENVIVFPQNGPRSMPDEMAGSDLDGDEYAVIWDPFLFFERNETAFAYCNDKPEKKLNIDEMDEGMNVFYAEFMNQEDVGITATNHLHQSDQYGINSKVCNILAEKNAMLLDYSKSGVAPSPLTFNWDKHPETKKWVPPEKSERKPDFANNRFSMNQTYQSSRLLGTLHRELRSVNDVVATSAEKQVPLVLDDLLVWTGWEQYKSVAEAQLLRYNGSLRSIMETFGVNTEAEVFSGYYREIRNRQSDKEQDDMSQYCTENVIETQVTALYRKFRAEFFEEFAEHTPDSPAYMRLTVPENERVWEEKDVLRRVCRKPSNAMMAKAVAYYRTCYQNAVEKGDRKLSFAWLAYDILNTVRGKKLLETESVAIRRIPQFQAISDHRNTYIADSKTRGTFGVFNTKCTEAIGPENKLLNQEIQARKIIKMYIKKNLELQKCLFIVDSWARAKGLLRDETDLKKCDNEKEKEDTLKALSSGLKWYHLSLMVIMVATNKLGTLIDENQNRLGAKVFYYIDPADDGKNESKLSDPELDRLTLSFFRYLSSRDFRRLRCLNFGPIGLSSVFMRGEWLPYHTAATQTYFNILLNLRFDELPISTEPISEKRGIVREGDPFFVMLPVGVNHEDILNSFRRNSKCVEIQGRIHNGTKPNKPATLIVSCRGTVEAINELRDFAFVKLPRYQWQMDVDIEDPREISEALTGLFYYEVMGCVWKRPVETPAEPQNNNSLTRNKPGSRGKRNSNRHRNGFRNQIGNNNFHQQNQQHYRGDVQQYRNGEARYRAPLNQIDNYYP
ncbi:hypothetical protein CAEBREN_18731 [Caenorhabditis brenneri]|uniref:RNA-directed RNA polymerase n=1 Tax=Caenorhabditis brenneri TaxID=135651 RepID=G0NLF5_CAEBE|nr:hypothetical protein CAEBREN_18731 [Caenorhabditis brenneri]